MVYLPPPLRRAISVLAAESGRRISDIHAEALGEYLQSRRPPETDAQEVLRMKTKAVPSVPANEQGSLGSVLRLLENQAHMMVDIQASTASLVPAVETRLLAIVIAALAGSGAAGLATPDIRALLNDHGFGGVRTMIVRDALLQAGVARCEDGRWIGLFPRGTPT